MTPDTTINLNGLPLHPSRSRLPLLLLAIPFVVGLHGLSHANQDFQFGMDYRMTYTAARAWLHGLDPYDDHALKQIWSNAGMPHATPPGLPQTPNVYPLTIAPLLAPLAALPFPESLAVWTALNAVAAAFMGFLILNSHRGPYSSTIESPSGDHRDAPSADTGILRRWLPAIAMSTLILGFPLRYGLVFGNLAVVTTMLVVATIRWRDRPVLAGVLLGISLVKYTLSAPLALVFLLERRWCLIGTASIVQVMLLVVASAGYAGETQLDWLPQMIASCAMSTVPGAVNDFAALDYSATHLEIAALLYRLAPTLGALQYGVLGLFILAAVSASRFAQTNRGPSDAFVELRYIVVLILTLITVYHRVYDTILVVAPLAAWLVRHDQRISSAIRTSLWIGLFLTMYAGCAVGGGTPHVSFAVLAFIQPICIWALLFLLAGAIVGMISIKNVDRVEPAICGT